LIQRLLLAVVVLAALAVVFLLPVAAREDPDAPVPVIELRDDPPAGRDRPSGTRERRPPPLPGDDDGGDDDERDDQP
jgi:hypothetical protein